MFKPHPIIIESVFPKNLSIRANVEPNPELKYEDIPYSLSVGVSEYDKTKKTISIAIKFETEEEKNKESKKHPFDMIVELVAFFKVDEDEFPIKHIDDWASKNAPHIVYPYLREQVYSLTVRAGFRPILLPLVTVPSFKLEKKDKLGEPQTKQI